MRLPCTFTYTDTTSLDNCFFLCCFKNVISAYHQFMAAGIFASDFMQKVILMSRQEKSHKNNLITESGIREEKEIRL